MRRDRSRAVAAGLAGAALLAVAPGASAEVRAELHSSRGWTVVIDSPNGKTWTPVPAHEFDGNVLNPTGDVNGDGRPTWGVRPGVGRPEVLYAVATPDAHELVLAQHDGEAWAHPRMVTLDVRSDDINPHLAYDDHGRSMILWEKRHDTFASMVAGLSIEARTWGEQVADPGPFRPLAIQSDGERFYFTTLHLRMGILRFRLAEFPFPNGGPALPFPDDTLYVDLLAEESTGLDAPTGHAGGGGGLGGLPSSQPATLAAVTLQMHRVDDKVWADWMASGGSMRWIAFRDGEVLDRGEEPLGGSGRPDQARDRIRRQVEGL